MIRVLISTDWLGTVVHIIRLLSENVHEVFFNLYNIPSRWVDALLNKHFPVTWPAFVTELGIHSFSCFRLQCYSVFWTKSHWTLGKHALNWTVSILNSSISGIIWINEEKWFVKILTCKYYSKFYHVIAIQQTWMLISHNVKFSSPTPIWTVVYNRVVEPLKKRFFAFHSLTLMLKCCSSVNEKMFELCMSRLAWLHCPFLKCSTTHNCL